MLADKSSLDIVMDLIRLCSCLYACYKTSALNVKIKELSFYNFSVRRKKMTHLSIYFFLLLQKQPKVCAFIGCIFVGFFLFFSCKATLFQTGWK